MLIKIALEKGNFCLFSFKKVIGKGVTREKQEGDLCESNMWSNTEEKLSWVFD